MGLEVRTEIRGRVAEVRWDGHRLTGDAELVERIKRAAQSAGLEWAGVDVTTVADLCRSATPAPLSLKVTEAAGFVGA